MQKFIFIFFVLFSTLAPESTYAIISHPTEAVNTPSVKKTDTKDFTEKDWRQFGYIMGGIGLAFGILGFVLTVPFWQLVFLFSALGCFIVAIVGLIKGM